MKRRLKLTVKIDFEKLMKDKNILNESDYYISKKEEKAIQKIIEEIHQITNCRTVEMCIEDLEHKEYDVFEKSSKMGSSSGRSWNFKSS